MAQLAELVGSELKSELVLHQGTLTDVKSADFPHGRAVYFMEVLSKHLDPLSSLYRDVRSMVYAGAAGLCKWPWLGAWCKCSAQHVGMASCCNTCHYDKLITGRGWLQRPR